MLSQPGRTDAACPAPGSGGNSSGGWLPPPHLRPISLRAHGVGIDDCALACNITEVSQTGVDPCNAGSIDAPVRATYSCYYGGPGWLKPKDLGVCGFNCSARHVIGGAYCSDADIKAGLCDIYCDPRDFPAGSPP